jgi:hypothetical protein
MTEEKQYEKVKPKKRASRRKCYDGDNPDHVCSPNHIRVPGHCRLKRFRRQPKEEKTSTQKVQPLREKDVLSRDLKTYVPQL